MSRVRIPIFPLNAVLFPKMPLPLHVFEKRYVALINYCVEEGSPFGLVLARDPDERGVDIARVGTFAHLQAVQKLDEDRYNVLVVGGDRFSVLARETMPDGYDMALVEKLTDMPADPSHLNALADELRRAFRQFFEGLIQHVGLRSLQFELPDDVVDLSFVVAAVVNLPSERRQLLLESTSTSERLQQEIAYLQRSIELLGDSDARAQVARLLDASKAREEISRN